MQMYCKVISLPLRTHGGLRTSLACRRGLCGVRHNARYVFQTLRSLPSHTGRQARQKGPLHVRLAAHASTRRTHTTAHIRTSPPSPRLQPPPKHTHTSTYACSEWRCIALCVFADVHLAIDQEYPHSRSNSKGVYRRAGRLFALEHALHRLRVSSLHKLRIEDNAVSLAMPS